MKRLCIHGLSATLLAAGFAGLSNAETLIDDFTTPTSPFGDAGDGDAVWDQPIAGAGFATSRDAHSQLVVDGDLPGQVTGGQLVITDLLPTFSQATLFMVYDAAGDASTPAVQTMPGGPFDMSTVTEFRIDASELEGDLSWFFAIGWGGGGAGSFAFPLSNGVNAIPTTSISSGVDFADVRTVHFGVINASETTPGSVKLDNFRVDASNVPEPSSVALLCLGGLAWSRRRGR